MPRERALTIGQVRVAVVQWQAGSVLTMRSGSEIVRGGIRRDRVVARIGRRRDRVEKIGHIIVCSRVDIGVVGGRAHYRSVSEGKVVTVRNECWDGGE